MAINGDIPTLLSFLKVAIVPPATRITFTGGSHRISRCSYLFEGYIEGKPSQPYVFEVFKDDFLRSSKALRHQIRRMSYQANLAGAPNVLSPKLAQVINGTIVMIGWERPACTLSQLLRARGGDFPLDELASIGTGSLKALNSAHQLGLYHGNLTTDTIFLMTNGTVKIGGWGIVKRRKGTDGPKSDIQALGKMIGELFMPQRFQEDNSKYQLRVYWDIIKMRTPWKKRASYELVRSVVSMTQPSPLKRPTAEKLLARKVFENEHAGIISAAVATQIWPTSSIVSPRDVLARAVRAARKNPQPSPCHYPRRVLSANKRRRSSSPQVTSTERKCFEEALREPENGPGPSMRRGRFVVQSAIDPAEAMSAQAIVSEMCVLLEKALAEKTLVHAAQPSAAQVLDIGGE